MADFSKLKLGRKAIKTDSRTLMLGDYLTPSPASTTALGRLDQGHHRLGHDAERYPGRLHHRRLRARGTGVDRERRQAK